jgi:hypothetical protein
MRETRPQTIIFHIQLALGRGMTVRGYAADVARLYNERTQADARTIEFHSGTDPYADERANAQLVQRFIDARTRMPAEIEEALVLALPDPFRGECKRDLAERYGDLAAPIPSCGDDCTVVDAGKLMEETGRALVELAQGFKDGVVVEGKTVTAAAAFKDLTDLIAQATTIRESVRKALGIPSQTISSTTRKAG